MYFINKLALAGAALALAGCATISAPEHGRAATQQSNWVASWTAAPHAPLATEGPFAAASYDNVTLTQIIRVTEGGTRLRVTFSNRYGAQPDLRRAEAGSERPA